MMVTATKFWAKSVCKKVDTDPQWIGWLQFAGGGVREVLVVKSLWVRGSNYYCYYYCYYFVVAVVMMRMIRTSLMTILADVVVVVVVGERTFLLEGKQGEESSSELLTQPLQLLLLLHHHQLPSSDVVVDVDVFGLTQNDFDFGGATVVSLQKTGRPE